MTIVYLIFTILSIAIPNNFRIDIIVKLMYDKFMPVKIKQKVKEIGERAGMNAFDMSKATGLSTTVTYKLYRGENNVTLGTIEIICNFFKLGLFEVIELVPDGHNDAGKTK